MVKYFINIYNDICDVCIEHFDVKIPAMKRTSYLSQLPIDGVGVEIGDNDDDGNNGTRGSSMIKNSTIDESDIGISDGGTCDPIDNDITKHKDIFFSSFFVVLFDFLWLVCCVFVLSVVSLFFFLVCMSIFFFF